MIPNRSLSLFALILALMCFAVASTNAAASPFGDCRATKATKKKVVKDDGTTVIEWPLTCSGKCPAGEDGTAPACEQQGGSDATGDYWFCGCDGAVGTECCQLISRWNKDGSETPDVMGDCPSCPASGSCQVVLAADGGSAQAACKQ